MQLADVRDQVNKLAERLQDRDGPCGCYRRGVGQRPDLYSSLDFAWIRAIMGEDLQQTLNESERQAWIDHINSYAVTYHEKPSDGSYCDALGHSPLHANGMVIGALGVLGGRKCTPCRLYDPFAEAVKVTTWLETAIDWSVPWSESHKFWGGMHCYSFASDCTSAWLDTVFAWLDANLDPATGWWRRNVEANTPHAYLGGAAHILPLYEHHDRTYPVPQHLGDSVLALQQPAGSWLPGADTPFTYLDLDALYALKLVKIWVPEYRAGEIDAAVGKLGDLAEKVYAKRRSSLMAMHPHHVLALVGTFGLLQQHLPNRFVDDIGWTDIFSDLRFYRTAAVEA